MVEATILCIYKPRSSVCPNLFPFHLLIGHADLTLELQRCLPRRLPHTGDLRLVPVPSEHLSQEPVLFLVGTDTGIPASVPSVSEIQKELLPEASGRSHWAEFSNMVPLRAICGTDFEEFVTCNG